MLILRRGAPIVGLTILLLIGAALLISHRQQALYQATRQVIVNPNNVDPSIADVQPNVDPQRVLETQASEARVPSVITATLSKFPQRPDHRLFLLRSTVAADPQSNVLTFTVTDPSRTVAAALATAYGSAYITYRSSLDTEALRAARAQVTDQLSRLPLSARTSNSPSYVDLTQRNQRLLTQLSQLRNNARLGQPGQDIVQVQPHTLRNAFLGGIFGILLGAGLLSVREALNTRVRTAADVEEYLGMPLLGRLYEPQRGLRARDELAMIVTPDAPETEAFQLLATNIEFTNLDRGAKSFMVTSANPAEGKSTSVANLAVTFARSGKRVILVDLDLRRPVAHRFFGLSVSPGITEVTLGRAWLDDALTNVPLWDDQERDADDGQLGGSLEILPAGPLPPNASEFVRSQALSDVLARLEERADLVLVDAPAMLAVSDAINLTPKVDALIVLTRVPSVRRQALEELRRILDNAPVAKVGFVLTGAEAEDGGFTGSYGYGYGYGDDRDGSGSGTKRNAASPLS
jgi:capsular exopolysaccharide synthesis family protein